MDKSGVVEVVDLGLVVDLVGGRQSGVIVILSVNELRRRVIDIIPSCSNRFTAFLTRRTEKLQKLAIVVLLAMHAFLPLPLSKCNKVA